MTTSKSLCRIFQVADDAAYQALPCVPTPIQPTELTQPRRTACLVLNWPILPIGPG